jgi:hypothetical protein
MIRKGHNKVNKIKNARKEHWIGRDGHDYAWARNKEQRLETGAKTGHGGRGKGHGYRDKYCTKTEALTF